MVKVPPLHHIPKDLNLPDSLLVDAADTFGTPLYIYDAEMLKCCWNQLRSILPENVSIYYSVKANPNISIIDVFRRMGACFEVASKGELFATMQAGVRPENIIFVGPGKTTVELEEAVRLGLQAVVAESQEEVEKLQTLSQGRESRTHVALRINLGQGSGSISMGMGTQFGMSLEVAQSLIERNDLRDLEIIGLHAYLGTGILDWRKVLENCELILSMASTIQEKTGKRLPFIDMGGGLGIPYYEKDEKPDWVKLKSPLADLVDEYIKNHQWTKIIGIESGRFLVGPAGVFISRVLYTKKNGSNHFIILDGGLNVFNYDRYYGARPYPLRVLGKEDSYSDNVSICGPLCTSIDRLAVDVRIPRVHPGDLMAFYLAGAYGLTASPGLFLSHGYPCEVISDNGQLTLIRERIDYDSIIASQSSSKRGLE